MMLLLLTDLSFMVCPVELGLDRCVGMNVETTIQKISGAVIARIASMDG